MPDIANVIAGILMKVPGIADAPSVMAAAAKVGGRSQRQPLRDKFFVQPMTAVVAPPNLSAHKPAGNCASRDDDRA